KLALRYREPAAEGEGWFVLAADGRSFAGQWRAKETTKWDAWKGRRAEPVPGRVWLVVVEARWERSLADKEYAFGNMLRAFFARTPNVQVRHRFFTDEASLKRWCGELAYLAEPAILVLATHGSPKGVEVDGKVIGAKAIGECLRHAGNLQLLHFSACQVMKESLAQDIAATAGKSYAFPISGYTTTVDWAASAIIEFTYLDMILSRGMNPRQAADQIGKLLPFSGDKGIPGTVFGGAGFRLHMPSKEPVGRK